MKLFGRAVCVWLGLIAVDAYCLSFTQKNIALGHPANGDMLLVNQEFLAVSGHSANERWLSLISLEDLSAQAFGIPANAQFFNKMKLAQGANQEPIEQLVFLTTEGVTTYSHKNKKLIPLLKSPSIFPLIDDKRLRQLSMVFDVNNSGLDDILIADFNAYHLWVQQNNGSFSHYPLSMNAKVETYVDVPRYSARKPYIIDLNLDNKKDIVFTRDGKLIGFLQQADGGFSSTPIVMTPGMEISLDGEASLRPGDGRSYEGLVINSIYDVMDLDGDALADLIIRRDVFANALDQNYDYLIHYGRASERGLSFNSAPDTRIHTRGIQFESVFADVNGDGRKDFYTPSAHFGIGTIVRALISGSAGLELQFYVMNEDRSFPEKPNHSHKASANVSISGGRVDLPLFQLARQGAGNKLDLLVGDKQERLIVRQSSDQKLFNKPPMTFPIDLPRDGSKVKVMDINNDGKDDLILPFDSQDTEKARNQVRVLVMQ